MIKPLLVTLGLTLLGANAVASTVAAPADTAKAQPAAGAAPARQSNIVASIDEDRIMAERSKG
jgi:hypothetical protein